MPNIKSLILNIFEFPRELEESYRRVNVTATLPYVRKVTALCFIINMFFAVNIWLSVGPASWTGLKPFVFFIAPGLFLWFLSTFWDRLTKHLHEITGVGCFLFLGAAQGLYIIQGITHGRNVDFYQPVGIVINIVVIYSAFGLPFVHASVSGWMSSIVCVIIFLNAGIFEPHENVIAILYVVAANIIGTFTAFMLERGARRDFLLHRTAQMEREKSDKLLLNILPESIAERLKGGETKIADSFEEVSVLFADIVGYTNLSSKKPPHEVVALLNEIFSRFDNNAKNSPIEKIKTIGDAYMAVSGLPVPHDEHANVMAHFALSMLQVIKEVNMNRKLSLNIRIGINSGPVVAGVIGQQKFIYDLWGDTVNVASRMESHGEPGQIQVSERTYSRLSSSFQLQKRGAIQIKGKGEMTTYWLRGSQQ